MARNKAAKSESKKTDESPVFVTSVMARNNWPNEFKRSVYEWSKDERTGKPVRGKIIETLTFAPGVATPVTAEQYEAVKGDIGKSLVEVEYDDRGKPRVISSAEEKLSAGIGAELEATIQGQLATIDEQAGTIAAQQEAIDLLVTQVKELGAEPVAGFDEPTETDAK